MAGLVHGRLGHGGTIVVADPMTDLGEVEFGEVAKRPIQLQQRKHLALPLLKIIVRRQREAGHRPPGFDELLHGGDEMPGERMRAGAVETAPREIPERRVPAGTAGVVTGDEERIAAYG